MESATVNRIIGESGKQDAVSPTNDRSHEFASNGLCGIGSIEAIQQFLGEHDLRRALRGRDVRRGHVQAPCRFTRAFGNGASRNARHDIEAAITARKAHGELSH